MATVDYGNRRPDDVEELDDKMCINTNIRSYERENPDGTITVGYLADAEYMAKSTFWAIYRAARAVYETETDEVTCDMDARILALEGGA